jgi:hypothetical protein
MMRKRRKRARLTGKAAGILSALFFLFAGCDIYDYGRLGGADKTETLYPGDPWFEAVMSSVSGVWYSHDTAGRLDGYRIGIWNGRGGFGELVVDSGKFVLFPARVTPYRTYTDESGGPGSDIPAAGDYFVLYDDTVYGQTDDTAPPRQSYGSAYCGLVRAVNIFYGNPNRGAIILEYLEGCTPQWNEGVKNGRWPFHAVYYRVLNGGAVQMADAVDLAAMIGNGDYHTETAHLTEAVAKNSAENEAEFISWGAVIPQDREN